jgi:hypothetical protein
MSADAGDQVIIDEEELERLRTENTALRAEVEHLATPAGTGRMRAIAVGVLIAVIAVTFTGAMVGVWARRGLVNQDVFVDRIGPLAQEPAVQAAVAARLTETMMELVDPQALFEEALPERGRILAVPLSAAVESFVADQMTNLVASEQFATAWERVVDDGHTAVIRLLEGDSDVVSATEGAIVINLVPIVDQALARLGEVSPQLFGQTIDIPTITADDVPEAARQRIAEALGREPSEEFGTIVIAGRGEALSAAQDGLRLFNTLVWVLSILTILLVPLALWLSGRRRRSLLQLAFVLALATVLVRRVVLRLQGEALEQVQVDVNRPAIEVITDRFVDPLLSSTGIILWVLAAVAVVALVTGPYSWASQLRALGRRLFTGGVTMVGSVSDMARDERTVTWIRTNRSTLQVAGAIVLLVLLWVFDLSWFGLLVLLLAFGAYLAALARFTEPALSEQGS